MFNFRKRKEEREGAVRVLSEKERATLLGKVDKYLQKSINDEIPYILDFHIGDLRTLYFCIWGKYPDTYNVEGDWQRCNTLIYENCGDYLIPYSKYESKSENVTMASFYIGDRIIVGSHYNGVYVLSRDAAMAAVVEKVATMKTEEEKKPRLYWVSASQMGYDKTELKIRVPDIDVENDYNDDFDYEKVKKFLSPDNYSGLMLFHGSPGTGKSFLIRHLAATTEEQEFLFFDAALLNGMQSTAFIDFLKHNENAVIVLEDCEAILRDRKDSCTNLLTTILNITDGILGEGLRVKFLCTFNTELANIDTALLRKGRLYYRYEFKPLALDKARKLAERLGKPLPDKATPLCDIYNDEDNNAEDDTKSPFGFDE